MSNIIRKTNKFEYVGIHLMGVTCLRDRKTGKQSNWDTGAEAQEEKELIMSFSDEEFNDYCEKIEMT